MEFHALRSEILSEIQLMVGVIEKKHTMPILANIYLKAENNQLRLQATDLEIGVITSCPAQVIEPGELTVNAKQFQDILTTFSDNQIGFSMNEGTMLDLVCGTAQFSVETMSAQDYPSVPESDFSNSYNFPTEFFSEAIDRIGFSISADPQKFALNGMLFRIENGELCLVSTDGHRLSVVNKEVSPDSADINVIIPRKTIVELQKSLKSEGHGDDFLIALVESRIFFKIGPRVIFSRLIDGKFPDYNKVVPISNDRSFIFDRAQLLNILRRKQVISSEKSKLVRFSFRSGELIVVLKNPEKGESIDKMGIDYEGDSLDIGLSVDYVHEFLKTIRYDKIELLLKDEASQALFKVYEDKFGFDYKHIIMPMRLSG